MSFRICSKEWVVGGLGLTLTILGIVLYVNWISWFTILRGKEMALSLTSSSFQGWKSSPLPIYFDIYLFNWTNPHEITNHQIKPKFQELGPYRFREVQDKVDIAFHLQNHSVTFRKKSLYYFDAESSNGSLSDSITTINMVAWAAVYKTRNGGFFERRSLQALLSYHKEDLTVTKTADELLFTGYKDPLVDIGSALTMFSEESSSIPYDRVGFFYMRNGSEAFNGLLNMYTGTDDLMNLGKIHTWNSKTHNGYYESYCGMINGSLGEFFPQNLKEGDSIELYPPNICRTIPLDYTESVEIHGVKALKFSGGLRSVDNGTTYPETKCFCVNEICERVGVMNMAPCQFGSTTYMSYPHFYDADPYYVEQIEGLKPVKEKHQFYMTLEPNTGIPLDVGGGFQMNMLIERVPNMGIYDEIPRVFLPIMWCEQRVRVTPEMAAALSLVPQINYWGRVFAGTLVLIGIILFCWYPIHTIRTHFTPKDQRKAPPIKTYEMKQIKHETAPFVEKNSIGTIIMKPQKLSLLGKSSDAICHNN